MSFSERLATGLGGIGETLWGTGPLNYGRGRLLAGRLAATDALTDYRQAQTRDLDFDYGNKSSLLNELKMAQEGTPEWIQRQGLMSGEGMTDYAGGQAKAYDLVQKIKAMEAMQKGSVIDPVTQLGIQLGQTGGDASLMAQRLGETPVKLQGLQDENALANALGQLQKGTELAKTNNLNALTDFNINRGDTEAQKLANLEQTNIQNQEIFGVKLKKAEQDFATAVSKTNKENAATELAILNQQIAGQKLDGKEAIAAEWDRVVEKFKKNPDEPLSAYESYILNTGREGKKVTGTDLTKAVTRKAEKELIEGKGNLTKAKIEEIKVKIEKLGLEKDKTVALTNLYKAREQDVKSGRANGNVTFAEAGRLYKELINSRHKNSQGAMVRWADLTEAEQRAVYELGIERILAGGTKLQGGALSKALGGGASTGGGTPNYKSQLQKHFGR